MITPIANRISTTPNLARCSGIGHRLPFLPSPTGPTVSLAGTDSASSPIEKTTHEAHFFLDHAMPGAGIDPRRDIGPEGPEHGLALGHPRQGDVRVALVAAQEDGHAVEAGSVVEAFARVAVELVAPWSPGVRRADQSPGQADD